MHHARVIHVGLAVAAAALLAGGLTFAQGQPPQVAIAEDQARAAALAAFPGTVLETELDRYSGRIAYEFKIQPQTGGLATDVHVDATTGVVLGTGNDTEEDDGNGPTRGSSSAASAAARAPAPAAARSAGPAFQEDFNLSARTLSDTGESRYFVLRPGFRSILSDGHSQLTITVFNETRTINGTLTRVVEERLETAGLPDEISLNFFAMDATTGDVFYFGEEVDAFQGGTLTGHPGTWQATGGNRPGLIMPGSPVVGMRYYQELAPGVAMDRAEVMSTSETCSTPAGDFAGCVVTRETSAIEAVDEQKSYAPGIGLIQDSNLRLVSYGYVDPGR
jgi:Peptidase propeptide and YPEB domain